MPVKISNVVLWIVTPYSLVGGYYLEDGEYTFLRNVYNNLQVLYGVRTQKTIIGTYYVTQSLIFLTDRLTDGLTYSLANITLFLSFMEKEIKYFCSCNLLTMFRWKLDCTK
jgi:hypothetical protein